MQSRRQALAEYTRFLRKQTPSSYEEKAREASCGHPGHRQQVRGRSVSRWGAGGTQGDIAHTRCTSPELRLLPVGLLGAWMDVFNKFIQQLGWITDYSMLEN